MRKRYQIRAVPDEGTYRLWDTYERRHVNKYGEPDLEYRAANRGVAEMRRDYLNYHEHDYDREHA